MKARLLPAALAALVLFIALPGARSAEPPDAVEIAPLAEYYGPVAFDHEMHTDLAESCATCHHHTAGVPPKEGACASCHDAPLASGPTACRGCHVPLPFSTAEVGLRPDGQKRYHIDVPGLKGAYHLSCMGCHEEMGGPTRCEECHDRTEKGDALMSADVANRARTDAHD